MNIIIVDDNDRPIGVKERSEIDYKVDIYRVSGLWITNTKGQILLAKRSALKDKDPGKWGPAVAGTNDEGETYEDNIYKEAMEEIGLKGVTFIKGPKIFVTHPRKYFSQWYYVTLDRPTDSFTMQVDEVDSLEWIDKNLLKHELITNPNKYIPSMQQTIDTLGV